MELMINISAMKHRLYPLLALVLICSHYEVQGSSAGQSQDATRDIRFIHENEAIGYEVYRVPTRDRILAARFKDGNQHGRFHINGTTGIVSVAGLMDVKVQAEYVLQIGIDTQETRDMTYTLTIHLIDSPDWPPIYNKTCAMRHREFASLFKISHYFYPLDITFNTKYGGNPSVNGIPLNFVVSEDTFALDIDNDKCKVQAYWSSHRRGLYLLASVHPNEIDLITCHVVTKTITSLPKWKIYQNPMIDRPSYELIKDAWFPSKSKGKQNDRILNEVTLAQYSSSETTQLECSAAGGALEFLSFYINIHPSGCPYDKYGGRCHQKCICRNGATCHPFNGACMCSAGWKGPDCTIPNSELSISPGDVTTNIDMYIRLTCTAHHYQVKSIEWFVRSGDDELVPLKYETSESAVLEFTRAAEHHSGVYVCQMKDIHNKALTQAVNVVVKDCQEDLYGKNCDKKCGCKNGATCDRDLGCVCPYGIYGLQCEHNCRCANNVTCRHDDGLCICNPGSWGIECQNDCICGRGSKTCEQISGKCECEKGWDGERCQIRLSASAVDPIQYPVAFVSLVAGLTCLVTIITAILICVVLHHKEKRKLDNMLARCRENRRMVMQHWRPPGGPPGEEEVKLLDNQDLSSEEDDVVHAVSHDCVESGQF